MPTRILIVEDEHALGTALELATRRAGMLPELVASGTGALRVLNGKGTEAPHAVVLDIGLPDMSGLEVLKTLRRLHPDLPVLVITAHGTLDHAMQAQQLGATDYLTKPLDLRQFDAALQALVAAPTAVANQALEPLTLVGGAAVMQPVFVAIAKASRSRSAVLISGPSGSGKTLAAKFIHQNAADGPLHSGQEAPSSAGTWLIEGLEQWSTAQQQHLAEYLAQPQARVIATYLGQPQQALEAGQLRADLFYVLSPLHIRMPDLQQRSADIPALAAYFLGLISSTAALSQPALDALQSYPWPGNVRELRAAVLFAAEQARSGLIYASHLPPQLQQSSPSTPVSQAASGELEHALQRWADARLGRSPESQPSYDQLLDQVETLLLQHLLERFGQKPTHLASALRMNRATLRQKLRRLLPDAE
jgi:DNA-binding NtrC family response regulator